MKDPYKIIKTVTITEKSNSLTEGNQYTFIVHPKARKPFIKKAVEQLFQCKVRAVNVINQNGKTKRTRYGTGRRSNFKKAMITLKKGEKPIELL